MQLQEQAANAIVAAWNGYRDLRDQMEEQTFFAIYGSAITQALLGTGAGLTPPRGPPAKTAEARAAIAARLSGYRAKIGSGGRREAITRAVLYVLEAERKFDERVCFALHKIASELSDAPVNDLKEIVRDQFFALQFDQKQALRSLPAMVPKAEDRETLARDLAAALSSAGEPTPETSRRLKTVSDLLEAQTFIAETAAIAGPTPKRRR